MDTMPANSASDMWAFGCIAYELLTGKEIFGSRYSDEDVMTMLIGSVSPLVSLSVSKHCQFPSKAWGDG